MAKQLGIHQIKGKVGQRSYYRTKGVVDGISRSINQGMSARVKNGDEYANTRLNNAEFKNANSIATAAFKQVPNRNRSMLVNFAIANMTKRALEDIKQGAGNWGARHPNTELDTLICDMLSNYAKAQSVLDGLISVETQPLTASGDEVITFTITKESQVAINELGVDTLMLVGAKCLAGEVDVDGYPRLYSGSAPSVTAPFALTGVSDITQTDTIHFNTPASVGMSPSGYALAQNDAKHGFYYIVSAIPMRTVNGQRHIIQEYSTFMCFPLGQIPEE